MRGVFAKTLPNPKSQYREKQRGYEIARSLDFEAGQNQLVSQFVRRVAAAMLEGLIMLAPQESVRRNRDQHKSLGLADAMDLPQANQMVIRVFQEVKSRHDIKRAAGKRKLFER